MFFFHYFFDETYFHDVFNVADSKFDIIWVEMVVLSKYDLVLADVDSDGVVNIIVFSEKLEASTSAAAKVEDAASREFNARVRSALANHIGGTIIV